MTKNPISLCAVIISILFFVSSCMKDDTASYSTYEDTAITAFTLGTVKVSRPVGKKKYVDEDSIYTYSYIGSNTPVYIDHLTREIYNTDSLPAGSHMTMLATLTSKNSATMTYRDWDAADDAAWTNYSSGDSIKFGEDGGASRELRFRVWASSGGYNRDYKVKILCHKEFADSFQYVALTPQAIFANAASLRGAATSEGLYVLAGEKLYCSQTAGTSWTEVKQVSGDATIGVADGVLYVLSGNTLHYYANSSWQSADVSGYGLKAFVGGCNGVVFAMNPDAGIMVAETSDLASWTLDNVYSNANLLPVKDISSACVVQRNNTDVSRITMVGNRAAYTEKGDTCAVVWNKSVTQDVSEPWIYNDVTESKTKSLALPAMKNLSATDYYNGWILAIGGKGLNETTELVTKPYKRVFCSEDGGTSWHKIAGLRMPDLTLDGDKPALILADETGYFYIISADGGKIYRCKLNNATWTPTDYREYK